MAVVINEFEVVAEPLNPPPQESAAAPEPAPPPSTAHDLERVLRRQRERAARLWAH